MNIDRLRAGNRSILTLAVLLLLVGVVSLVGLVDASLTATRPAAAQAPASSDFPTTVRQIAADVRPAVVQITSEQLQVGQFNQPFSVPSGVGSGVLYDAQGHILTNDHVVAGARQLLVSLPDRAANSVFCLLAHSEAAGAGSNPDDQPACTYRHDTLRFQRGCYTQHRSSSDQRLQTLRFAGRPLV